MENAKRGAPFKKIKKEDFEKLCALQCTQQEIADFFECDHKTLTSWCKRTYKMDYSQVYSIKRTGGKIALRRLQLRLAEKSAAMAIFLGKQYLDQTETPLTQVSISNEVKANNALINALNESAVNITVGDEDEPERDSE